MKIEASDMIENVANRIAQPADGFVVDVTSDLICPWCFVAKRGLEKASSILGKKLEARWHPFQLNPEMPLEGLDRRLYRSAKFGSWEQSQRLDAPSVDKFVDRAAVLHQWRDLRNHVQASASAWSIASWHSSQR